MEAKPPDSVDGFDRAPDRYMATGRETIDRIRDELGDLGFVAFCRGTAMKYDDRAGLKGCSTEDRSKQAWYLRMARHVEKGDVEDPRSGRPGFVPYSRHKTAQQVADEAAQVGLLDSRR